MGSLDGQHFDVIVLGTGLTESILAAALAKIGKKVLHLDKDDFYGSNESTLPIEQFRERFDVNDHQVTGVDIKTEEPQNCFEEKIAEKLDEKDSNGRRTLHLMPIRAENSKFQYTPVKEEAPLALTEELKARDLCVDLSANLILCRGDFVDTLVRSGVARYLEFKMLSSSNCCDQAAPFAPLRVPCSKAEVFKTKALSLLEKRQLMKFLQYSMDKATSEENKGDVSAVEKKNELMLNQGRSLSRPQNKKVDSFLLDNKDEGGSFLSFLEERCKLSPKLSNVVRFAVALVHGGDQVSYENGMQRVQRYLQGIGRFGGTAFLYPMYGTGELAQAFTRMCAVNGGVYVLRQGVTHIIVTTTDTTDDDADHDENTISDVRGIHLANGDVILTNQIVADPVYAPRSIVEEKNDVQQLQRMVCVTKSPLLSIAAAQSKDEVLKTLHPKSTYDPDLRAFLAIPPQTADMGNPSAIHVLQLDSGVKVSPKGMFLIHLSTISDGSDSSQEAFSQTIQLLVSRAKEQLESFGIEEPLPTPTILWSTRFKRQLFTGGNAEAPNGLFVTNIHSTDQAKHAISPLEISLFHHIIAAKATFLRMGFDERDFFPEPAEEDTAKEAEMHGEMDDIDALNYTGVKLPQLVDLKWFHYLGGRST